MSTHRLLSKRTILTGALALALGFCALTLWQNSHPQVTRVVVTSQNVPSAFDGYRIAHISDVHNARFGQENARLISAVREQRPDLIAVTGDLVRTPHADTEQAVALIRELSAIAPCYVVSGNHESRLGAKYAQFEHDLWLAGAYVLNNQSVELSRQDAKIQLSGIVDPEFATRDHIEQNAVIERELGSLAPFEGYRVLLSHRPEAFSAYVQAGYGLVLSGHTHGGQVRLPGIGAIIAPHQGFFPRYDTGLYQQDNTTMYISRGLGTSVVPLRINDRPEIVLLTLATPKTTR